MYERALFSMSQVFTLANHKGGVGKSSVCFGLADALEVLGRSVLVVDLDPQASITKFTGIDTTELPTMADLFALDEVHAIGEICITTDCGFDLAPSDIVLATQEQHRRLGDEQFLKKAMEMDPLDYDEVLIDCPPSLGLLTVNALIAADALMVITQPNYASLKGIRELMTTYEKVREFYNEDLEVVGAIVNMVERTRECGLRVKELEGYFEEVLWTPYIPKRVAVAEAQGMNTRLSKHKANNAATKAFHNLAERMIHRGERSR